MPVKERPRALFVAPMLPDRGGNGLAMRLGVFVEALARFADVELAVIPVAGGPAGRNAFLDALAARVTVHHLAPETATHFRLLSRLADPAARLDAFRQYGLPSLARGLSARIAEQVAQIATRTGCDLVHVARAYMIPAIAAIDTRVPLTLDLDEDDRTSFLSRAAFARRAGDASSAGWLAQEGDACDALIAAHARRFRNIFAASRRDGLALAQRHAGVAVDLVHNAIEMPGRAPRRDDGRTAVFVGSFGYQPNVDALLWFVRDVMPALAARRGGLRLIVSGADAPPSVRALGRHPNIRVLGRVGDLGPVYRRATFAVAPMRGGGGSRIKIIEAAAFGVPVVADRDSAAALFGPDRPWGWSGPNAAGLAAACAAALRDPAERGRRGRLGYDAVVRHHARPVVVARLAQALRRSCGAQG